MTKIGSPFQEDLIEYLSYYSNPLSTWKKLIESTDFSTVTDRLIFSTPGYHTDPQQVSRLGHPRLSTILSQKFPFDPKYEHTDRCTFIAQCSSIGSLGSAPSSLKNVDQLMIRSWEIGVLITDPSRFNIPFDYPCVPYSPTDRPFTTDQKHEQPDILGCVWNP
ncbi:hypothetical protein GCK72_016050 [Caenorhabditis remanei]|uniref:Uncharacterized protein n=1 Tax=Caenorhabditis remanei TaxID=31234 RepID=A0A6A5GYV4_CAERE|nr:hypothetical protein GCK72_016050 [Caenorhabditis remanei]KAF1759583.1 hypothetical protein GCK72_016050 [Caenorhabditis remanei]